MKVPLEAPSVLVLGVGNLGTGFAGVVAATLCGFDVSGDVVSLEDLRRCPHHWLFRCK